MFLLGIVALHYFFLWLLTHDDDADEAWRVHRLQSRWYFVLPVEEVEFTCFIRV